jgi:hypothetical protein
MELLSCKCLKMVSWWPMSKHQGLDLEQQAACVGRWIMILEVRDGNSMSWWHDCYQTSIIEYSSSQRNHSFDCWRKNFWMLRVLLYCYRDFQQGEMAWRLVSFQVWGNEEENWPFEFCYHVMNAVLIDKILSHLPLCYFHYIILWVFSIV